MHTWNQSIKKRAEGLSKAGEELSESIDRSCKSMKTGRVDLSDSIESSVTDSGGGRDESINNVGKIDSDRNDATKLQKDVLASRSKDSVLI